MDNAIDPSWSPHAGDALIIVDLQNDFLPGGSLAVPQGEEIIPIFNQYIQAFKSEGLPIFATRDWHPPAHCSFKEKGGPWPPHCIAGTKGAQFPSDLHLPPDAMIISKGTGLDKDAYSGFEGTDLNDRLRPSGLNRLWIGGLATDYCVLNTVRDGIKLGYQVCLLKDAISAVNVNPNDGEKAEKEMSRLGAIPVNLEMIE